MSEKYTTFSFPGEFPPEYTNDSDDEDDYIDDETASITGEKHAASISSGNNETPVKGQYSLYVNWLFSHPYFYTRIGRFFM